MGAISEERRCRRGRARRWARVLVAPGLSLSDLPTRIRRDPQRDLWPFLSPPCCPPLSLRDPPSDLPTGIRCLSGLQSGFAARSSPVSDLAPGPLPGTLSDLLLASPNALSLVLTPCSMKCRADHEALRGHRKGS